MNIIRSLLAAGIDTDACCQDGQTALYRAAEFGGRVTRSVTRLPVTVVAYGDR